MTEVGEIAQIRWWMLEGGVTNGHFDVVVIELVAFLEGRFFCRSVLSACMTKGSIFVESGGAELSGHIGHASPIYRGVGGNSEGCNMGGEVKALFLKALSVLGEGTVREKRLWIIAQAMVFVLGNLLIAYATVIVMFDQPIVLYFTPILFTGVAVAIVVIGWKKRLYWIDPNTEGREIAIAITITLLSLVIWIRILYEHYEIMRYWWM